LGSHFLPAEDLSKTLETSLDAWFEKWSKKSKDGTLRRVESIEAMDELENLIAKELRAREMDYEKSVARKILEEEKREHKEDHNGD